MDKEYTDKLFVGTKIEYAVAAVTTDKIFPKVFLTEDEANRFKDCRPDPSHWKLVSREVTYGEWK